MPSLVWALRRAAEARPGWIATVDGDRRASWSETAGRAARLAGALRVMGLRRAGGGEEAGRVAILALNGAPHLEATFATLWAGGVVVPINARLAPPEVEHVLADSGAEMLIHGAEFAWAAALPAAAGLKAVVPIEEIDRLVEGGDAIEDAGRSGDDLAALFYTGGTTGRAKGVMLSHRNLGSNALNAILVAGYDETTVCLHAAPLFHLAGAGPAFAVTQAAGTHVFIPRFDPAATLAAIGAERVTHVLLVPTMVNMLVNHPGAGDHDLSSLRRVIYGASPMPEATLKGAMALMPGALFQNSYGMTETSPFATMMPPGDSAPETLLARRLGSCGRAMPTVEVRVVDGEGREAPRGTVGEVTMRGPTVMLGYWRRPEATAQALKDGWMRSGDAGVMDAEGYLAIVDRMKDMIISGGENVYSSEVESAISTLPGVRECAVIGLPDERWGERVHAIVVPQQGRTLAPQAVIAHCRGRIAGYKCPRSVEIRAEPLPVSGAGKILKSALRGQVPSRRPAASA